MRFSIRKKLIGGFLAVVAILIISGIVLFNSLTKMDHSYQDLLERRVDILIGVSNISKSTVAQTSGLRDYLLSETEESLTRFKQINEQQLKQLESLGKMAEQDSDKKSIAKLVELSKSFVEKSDKVIALSKTDFDAAEKQAVNSIIPIGREMEYEVEKMVKAQQQLLDEGSKENQAMSNGLKLMNLIMIVVTSILAMVIGYAVSVLISKPLRRISQSASLIADGDLTEPELAIKNRDEIGDLAISFNRMKSNLHQLLKEIHAGAEHVAASSEELNAGSVQTSQATVQISASIQRVAEGTEHQVQSVSECVQAVHEMSEGVKQINANAQSVSQVVIATAEKSVEGNEAIQSAVQQMQSINHTMEDLSHVIAGLANRSKDIGEIVQIITEIARQTNLLALNAAIESARAGEHGKGFAVVANEVRNLAEQSAQSAQQITELVTVIQKESKTTQESVEVGRKEVAEGIRTVNQAGEAFEHIHHSISQVSDEIQNVSASVQQMSVNTEQVVGSINSISQAAELAVAESQTVSAATQEQLASMEEISISAGSLSTMAEQLQSQVGKFKI
ncbi:methyl-accepting chemotaxis protein [Paenibacillus guangzhouensis]|uniref:methyl-accepting chemotaxis protein n=1 Tax=Paenibacillus guangzhouensis TaxID=1473112 RepID=UPI0012675AC9|nr:methyl-accepting chemotaxis protein [Paenibacillus guangzhouensis]